MVWAPQQTQSHDAAVGNLPTDPVVQGTDWSFAPWDIPPGLRLVRARTLFVMVLVVVFALFVFVLVLLCFCIATVFR